MALGLLVLTGCSGGSRAVVEPIPTPSCDLSAPTVPASCIHDDPSAGTSAYPSSAAQIKPVDNGAVKGRVAGADNSADPARDRAAFTVTVPKGQRIGSIVDCRGNGTVTLDTSPASQAYQSISCNGDDPELPTEFVVEDSHVLAAPTAFQVTVTVTPGTRWAVSVFSTTAALGHSQE